MATATAAPPVRSGWSRRTRVVGWALLVGWIALTALVVVTAPRDATRTALRAALESGDVATLQVAGGIPDDEDTAGYGELQLRWRDGPQVHQVTLREARPIDDEARDTDLDVVPVGEVARLHAQYPDVEIERVSSTYDAGLLFSVLDREIQGWVAWAGVLLAFVTFGLLVAGPEPWRATRWAWFWILWLITPVGFLAYLLLGGPTGVGGAPRAGARRLTGGWSLLGVVLLSGLVTAAVTGLL